METALIYDVKMSYGRALADQRLMQRFYENFIARHPAVALKFAGVDLERQQEVLRMTLSMAIVFPQKNVVAKRAMDKLRDSHGEEGMKLAPDLYDHWLESLLETLASSDPQFNQALAEKWRVVLEYSIKHISCPAAV